MKLLIKTYFENINSYNIMNILDLLNSNMKDSHICITSNIDFNFEPYKYYYFNDTSIPNMINYKLSELHWDILLPIYKPIVSLPNFDIDIKNIYNQYFPNLDGVLWLNDGVQKEINTLPIIGRKYYDKFGYIYNPIYKTNFEKEFTDVSNILNKSKFIDKIYLKELNIKSDDDNIYELRKKFNFGL